MFFSKASILVLSASVFSSANASGCVDAPYPMYFSDAQTHSDCSLAQAYPDLCDASDVQTHCPVTCGTCDQYACVDSTAVNTEGGKTKSCGVLADQPQAKINQLCGKTPIQMTCRALCDWDCTTPSPTAAPTASPTASPTSSPTDDPTAAPTASPTASPTSSPTDDPTAAPTASPTAAPTSDSTPAYIDFEDGGEIVQYVSDVLYFDENFYTIHGANTHPGSGYEYGAVSGVMTLFNAWANDAVFSCPDGSFDLKGMYITPAWNDGISVTFTGTKTNGGAVSTSFTLGSTKSPVYYSSQFSSFVDVVSVKASSGGGNNHIAIDDLFVGIKAPCYPTSAPTPSPTTAAPTATPPPAVMDFEDAINTPLTAYANSLLSFDNWWSIHGANTHPGSGYEYGAVSGVMTIFNAWANPATFSCPGGSFDLGGMWITPAWESGNYITFTGTKTNGSSISTGFNLGSTTSPVYYSSQFSAFTGMSSITVTTGGGNTHVAVDDLLVTITQACTVNGAEGKPTDKMNGGDATISK